MKTLQELYNEIIAGDELKTAFAEAAKGGKTMEFLKAQGCEATEEELAAFLKNKSTGEISDEELDNVAGGTCDETLGVGIFVSICSGLAGKGVTCVAEAISSATSDIARSC
jgi:hypothetical protein